MRPSLNPLVGNCHFVKRESGSSWVVVFWVKCHLHLTHHLASQDRWTADVIVVIDIIQKNLQCLSATCDRSVTDASRAAPITLLDRMDTSDLFLTEENNANFVILPSLITVFTKTQT